MTFGLAQNMGKLSQPMSNQLNLMVLLVHILFGQQLMIQLLIKILIIK